MATSGNYNHPAAGGKAAPTRPLMIPEVDEEDDRGGVLPVVSETTGRSSSRLSSARLCDLEKLLSVDSDTSRTSDGAGGTTKSDNSADSGVMYTPFSDNWQPRQPPDLSPVPSCDYMPSTSSASLREALQCVARKPQLSVGGETVTAGVPMPRRKALPHSARASPVVGSPGRQCVLERSVTCHAGPRGVDMAAAMEAALRSIHMQVSSSAELASRCLPSVTLTTSSMAPASSRGRASELMYSRLGSCPGPVPCTFAPVRCGGRTAE